jgi:hypothetical protein
MYMDACGEQPNQVALGALFFFLAALGAIQSDAK